MNQKRHELQIDRSDDPLVIHRFDEQDPLKIRQVEDIDLTGENSFPIRAVRELGVRALDDKISKD
jgi:hypothetical protein